jgi:hypothetical protein
MSSALVHGEVEVGNLLDGPDLEGVGADVGVALFHVVEGPGPLLTDDVDGHLGLGRLVAHGVLGLDRVEEQDPDDQERDERVEQLERKVVGGLPGGGRVAGLATVPDHGPADQTPHDAADDEGGDPRPQPQVADMVSLLGRRHGKPEVALGAGRQGDEHHRDHGEKRRTGRPPSRRGGVATHKLALPFNCLCAPNLALRDRVARLLLPP